MITNIIFRRSDSPITSDKPHYPYELPKGWAWCKLEDFINDATDFVASGSFASLRENVKYYDEPKYAILVRTKDFQNGFTKGLVYTDRHGYEFLANSNLFGGELILPNIGASIGKVFIVPHLDIRMTLAPNSIMIKCFKDTHKKWLQYLFLSPFGQEQLRIISSSTAQGKFNKTDLRALQIPIPPLDEQERIISEVEFLSHFVEMIEYAQGNLQETIKQAKSKILDLAIHGKLVPQDPTDVPASELLKRINPKAEITCDNGHYQKLPFKIPKSWVWCGHNDILEISGGSQPAKNHFISVPKDNYIRLYQIRDYGDNPIPVYIPEELASKRTEKGDILLARYGGSLGKVFHAETGAYNVAMAKVIFKYPNVIVRDFAYYYYLSDLYQGRLKEISRTAQAGFNSSDFNEMFFPLPPYEEQKRIVNAINKTFTILDTIMENL